MKIPAILTGTTNRNHSFAIACVSRTEAVFALHHANGIAERKAYLLGPTGGHYSTNLRPVREAIGGADLCLVRLSGPLPDWAEPIRRTPEDQIGRDLPMIAYSEGNAEPSRAIFTTDQIIGATGVRVKGDSGSPLIRVVNGKPTLAGIAITPSHFLRSNPSWPGEVVTDLDGDGDTDVYDLIQALARYRANADELVAFLRAFDPNAA